VTNLALPISADHSGETPVRSLVEQMAAQLNDRNLVSFLASGIRPLQHAAWKRLVRLPDAHVESLLLGILESVQPQCGSILTALTHESVPISDMILERTVSLLSSSNFEIRKASAGVIALHRPQRALPLLRRDRTIDRDVLRRLCLADDPSLIEPLANAFGFPLHSPPPTIGFVVSPEWLADNHARSPQLVEWLSRNCGYCDDEITPEVLNLLSSGFSYVTSRLTSEPRLTKIAHRWQRRIRAFVWRLLPDELDLIPDDKNAFDPNNPLDVDLFLAAVRDTDRQLFVEQKLQPPFGRLNFHREPSPACFHASSRFIRRMFFEKPLAQAETWGIAENERGEFLLQTARIQLEPHHEARTAASLAFRGRWLSRTTGCGATVRSLVIQDFNPPASDDRLSPGADSIKNLASASGLDWRQVAEWLAEAETRWSKCLTPIGIEVQIPRVDPDHFAAWKDALPFLGIPSAVRPEFGGMVEAAFRPARSFHALALGPLLLVRRGLIAEPQDMALHISLQGRLGSPVNSLAFPQLFIHPSERLKNRTDKSMARVMSKGFVHVHKDAESTDQLPDAESQTKRGLRTELRLFRVFADAIGDSIELQRGYISDLISVHVLGSACLSSCPRCRGLFDGYAREIVSSTAEMSPEFHRLLVANYLEFTGDPQDEQLLKRLPIFRCWSDVRDTVRSHGLSADLDIRFRSIRHRHVRVVLEHWSEDHGIDPAELRFTNDEIELTSPIDGLQPIR
jgi:hypothetical protein